jgi:hypothetical protein
MVVGLRGYDLLLNTRQQLLGFGQRQTQLPDLAQTIRPVDRHHVGTPGAAIDPRSDQPQHPIHPSSPSQHNARPVLPP